MRRFFLYKRLRSNSVGIAIKNAQSPSEPVKQDNPIPPRERTNGDPDPRGTETQPPAIRPVGAVRRAAGVSQLKRPSRTAKYPLIAPDPRGTEAQPPAIRPAWRCAARGRRDRGQEISIESHISHRTGAKCGDRAASPRRTAPRPNSELRIPNFELFPPSPPRAHTLLPELKPARDNAAPARNSPTNNDSRRCAASARTHFQALPAPAAPAFPRRTSALQARADKYPTACLIHAHKKAPSSPTQARRSQLSVIR